MAQSNPPSGIPLVQRPLTRIVPSGTLTLGPGATALFPGSNNRQDRIQIVISNLDAAKILKVQTANGVTWGTLFPQLPWTVETSADIQILNPDGAATVSYEVGEIYPDTGNFHGVPRGLVNQVSGGTGTPAGGGGTPAGGGGSSTDPSGGRGGTYLH